MKYSLSTSGLSAHRRRAVVVKNYVTVTGKRFIAVLVKMTSTRQPVHGEY